mmetsp:Transcript_9511/g.7243  ORF Transcript_9511/g.7243 Transcript_9511/m.7243 type:complete len:103 (+) Transcript_9511:83-391(+)
MHEMLKSYEPSPLRTDFDAFSFKIVVNAMQAKYNYYVRVRMPFVQFEVAKESFKYLKEATLKVNQVFLLLYTHTYKNWEQFVEENFLNVEGDDIFEGGANDI